MYKFSNTKYASMNEVPDELRYFIEFNKNLKFFKLSLLYVIKVSHKSIMPRTKDVRAQWSF